MLKLLWAECQKLRRLSIVWITVFATILIAIIVFVGGKDIDYGASYVNKAGWYMTITQVWATVLALPAVIALFGSYLICREEQDDTIKSLRLIPINEAKLTAAKMIITFVVSILLYLLLFVITFLTEAILHFSELSVAMVCGYLKNYFLDGFCIFFAISPMIAFSSYFKKGYWLALVLTEVYSFMGLFTSMSNTLRSLYPITAVLGISGYYETSPSLQNFSYISLLICSGLAIAILCGLNKVSRR